jgi:hypothetical protein
MRWTMVGSDQYACEAQTVSSQRDTLKAILNLLVIGISGCAMLDVGGSNHGTETAEKDDSFTPGLAGSRRIGPKKRSE